jgi:hypothetical protein
MGTFFFAALVASAMKPRRKECPGEIAPDAGARPGAGAGCAPRRPIEARQQQVCTRIAGGNDETTCPLRALATFVRI